MPDRDPKNLHNCSWCKREIGKTARVCPHCYRGQGIWIAITAVPTWLSAVVAVAATSVAVWQIKTADYSALEMAGRVEAVQVQIAATKADLLRIEGEMSTTRAAMAERPLVTVDDLRTPDQNPSETVVSFDSSALEAAIASYDRRIASAEQTIVELHAAVDGASRDANEALQASVAARKTVAAVEEDVQKGRDSFAMSEIENRVDTVKQRFRETVVACRKGTETDCQAAKEDTVTLFASLSTGVENYRGYVSDISHSIMIRDACSQGKRMAQWSPSTEGFAQQSWGEFSGWYRSNCD